MLQCALGEAGIPSLGLWAQVPHYVSATPSPPAVRALLGKLHDLADIDLDLAPLDAQVDEYTARVEEGLAERPDVAELVTAIEEQVEGEVSGDDLAAEIERRPAKRDMTVSPYLPRASVAITSARAYLDLLTGAAS